MINDRFLKAKLEFAKVFTELSTDELIYLECRILAAIYGEAVGVDPKHIKIIRRSDPERGNIFDIKIYGKALESLPENKAALLTTKCFLKIGRKKSKTE